MRSTRPAASRRCRAPLVLIVADTGDTPEKAKNAAQRLVAQEPALVGGSVGQVSAFGLASTEVTERAHLPWLTFSYADQFVNRGFKYMFKTAVDASKIPAASMPILSELAQSATGRKPTTVAIISDDTPAAQGATKAFSGVLAQQNMEIVVNESFTPPISDATPIVQRVRSRETGPHPAAAVAALPTSCSSSTNSSSSRSIRRRSRSAT